MPPVTGKFQADFTSFYTAVKKADAELDSLEKASAGAEKRLNTMANAFSGSKIIQQANVAVEAMTRVGDATNLTEKEQKKLNDLLTEAIAKYHAIGQEAPAEMVALANATKQITPPDVSGVSKTFDDLGTSIKSTMLGFVGAEAIIGGVKAAFSTLVEFVGDSINSYASAEAAAKKMTVALQAQGTATPAVVGRFNDLATQFQKTTVYSDDLINEMQALLTEVGDVAPAQMEKALKAATDLASGLGVDLQTATTLVAKAMEGNTGALKKYGVAIDEASLKTQGADAIFSAIQSKFGGQAQAQLDTYAGKLAQLANNWDNVKEAIGKSIVTDELLQLALRKLSGAADETAGSVDSLGESFLTMWVKAAAGPTAGNLVLYFEKLAGVMNRADAAAKKFQADMPSTEEFEHRMAADLAAFDKKHPGLDQLREDAQKLINEGLRPLSAAQRDVALMMEQSGKNAAEIADKMNVSELAVKKVLDANKQATDAAKKLAEAQQEVAKATIPLTAAQRDFAVANDRIGVSAQTTATSLGVSAAAVSTYLESLKTGKEVLADQIKMQEEWRKATAKLQGDAAKDYLADQRKQADASGKAIADQLNAAQKFHDKNADLGRDATDLALTRIERERAAAIDALTKQSDVRGGMYDKATAEIDKFYDHQRDLANETEDTLEERLRAHGIKTRGELETTALKARQEYELMKASGLYTADQVRDAFHRMTSANAAAAGDMASATIASLGQIASAFASLASTVGGSAGSVLQAISSIAAGLKAAKEAEKEAGGGPGGILAPMFSADATASEKWAAGVTGALTAVSGAISVWNATAAAGSKSAGAFMGAMSGAAAGAAFGPWGAAIGGAAGAVAGLIHSLDAGRRAVKDFAASFGGFDELHAELLKVGDAGEQMWIKLTQQTGRGDKAAAERTIKQIQDLIASAPSTMAEEMGYKTQAELQEIADKAKQVYEYMVSSGKYTAAQIADAFAKMTDAQKTAIGDAAENLTQSQKDAQQAIDDLSAKIKGLYDSIKDEAPEEEMGSIERNTRAQIKALEDQQVAAKKALDDSVAQSAAATADGVGDIGDGLAQNQSDWDRWAANALGNLDAVGQAASKMPLPGTPTGVPGFASGTGGRYLDFGAGTLAMLHGRERISRPGEDGVARGGGTVIIQVDRRTLAELVVPEMPGVITRYGLGR